MSGTLIIIAVDSAFQHALAQPASVAGLSLLSADSPEIPARQDGGPVVVALDHRLVTADRSLPSWVETIRADQRTAQAAIVLVTSDPDAVPGSGSLEHCDDVASISDSRDLERAFVRGRKLSVERMYRGGEEPETRTRLREIVAEGLSDVIFQLGRDLRINYVNPAWTMQFGTIDDGPIGHSFLDYLLPENRDAIERALRRLVSGEQTRFTTETALVAQDGRSIWMELRALADPYASSGSSITGLLLDISSRRESEAELRASHERFREMALRDPLTGLSNRLVFADRLQHALEVGARRGSGLALLFIDLDSFKPVNDTYGHAIGDRVLAAVAARMNEQIRAGDTLARYGGDEFAVILEDLSDPTQALQIADRLIESLREPLKIGVEEISVGICVGITLLSGRSVTPEEAIAEADSALYQAKEIGRRQYRLYEPGNDPGKENRYRFDLRRGMRNQELTILYLPIVDFETNQVSSLEARVRWDHPSWGRLSPGQFLRRADASELMGELAREALFLIARDIERLAGLGLHVPQIRIATAVWQAIDSDLIRLFTAALGELGLQGKQFAIELMDGSNVVERDAIRPVLDGLRALGVDIGFDNFMTGVTPLGSVIDLNPVYVNLYAQGHALADKGYNTREIAEAARMLCDRFGWELIAKDIDTPAMLDQVKRLPIRFGQGEAIASGMGVDELGEFLRNR
jgi:diguanylate cyclase (GGDEF)-like protein/PAS domain S-box-containing protein